MVVLKKRRNENALDQKKRKEKLKQLTERSNLPVYMGELILEEIKLSNDKANEHLRERVKLLGLW